MMPVSLTYADLVRLIRVSIGAALLVAIGIMFLRWSELQEAPLKVLLQTASTAIGIPPLLVLAFSKLNWTRSWLAWLRVIYRLQVRGRGKSDGSDTNCICDQADLFLSHYPVVYVDAARTLDARDLGR